MKTILRLKSVLGVVSIVLLFFVLMSVLIARNMASLMIAEARKTAQGVVRAAIGKIDQLTLGVETAVANQRWVVQEHFNDPDFMFKITRELVGNNKFIFGSTMAYRPGYIKGHDLFAPYSCESTNGVIKSFPLGEDYNYPEWSWYSEPMRLRRPTWSEPFFDEGGGDILMSTYSIPVFDSETNICAILTADLSLKLLTEHVAALRPYPKSYAVLRSAKGATLVAPPDGRANPEENADETITIKERASNGWTVEVVCPVEELLRSSHRMMNQIVGFSVVALVAIFLISWYFSTRLERTATLRERMAGELNTARSIQGEILRKNFPPDLWACLRPAREVGGDLYDFARQGDTLYFIVGDASGKGVPAALFSMVAGTVFRMACNLQLNPGEILGRINAALAENNDLCMFVTAFVGAFNVKTGLIEFGCAGHNAPVVITPDGKADFLTVKRGPPTGALRGTYYDLQSAQLEPGSKIIVYTDGVTEAEKADKSQYGNQRLLDFAAAFARSSARELAEGLVASVDAFVGANEQFDDITVLCIG